jgi:hypothetical protein
MDAVISRVRVSDLGGLTPARVARGLSSSFAYRVAYFLLIFCSSSDYIKYVDTTYCISS